MESNMRKSSYMYMWFGPNQFCNDTVINQMTHETCLLFVIKDWFQFDTDLIIDAAQAE